MTKNLRDAILARRKTFEEYEKKREYVPCVLVSVNGSVAVSGRPRYAWVQELANPGSVFMALNLVTSMTDGLPVIVGKDLTPPYSREVVSKNTSYIGDISAGSEDVYLAEHAASHQWPEGNRGPDAVTVFQPALYPLKAESSNGLTVRVHAYRYFFGWTYYSSPETDVDLSSHVPGSGLKRYALVYIDQETNTVQVVDGTAVADSPTVPAPKPNLPASGIPVAFVKLQYGQLVVGEVVDARILFGDGVNRWTDLTDTPSTIESGKWVKGDDAGTALEFADDPTTLKGVTLTDVYLHLPFNSFPKDGFYDVNLLSVGGESPITKTAINGVWDTLGKFGRGAIRTSLAKTNEVDNPVFKNNITDGWTSRTDGSGGTTTHDTDHWLYESAAAKFLASDSGVVGLYNHSLMDVADGETAFSSVRVWGSGKFTFQIRSGGTVYYNTEVTLTAGVWNLIEGEWTNATGSSVTLGVALFNSAADSSSEQWVDAVQLINSTHQIPFFYGDMNGGSWAGTSHNSASSIDGSKLEYNNRVNPYKGTIGGWVRVEDNISPGGQMLFSLGDINNEFNAYIHPTVNVLRVAINGATGIDGAVPTVGEYFHFAVMWDYSANEIKCVVNGVQHGSTYNYTTLLTFGSKIGVMCSAILSATYTTNGYGAEWFTSQRPYTVEEIKAIFDSQAPAFVTNDVLQLQNDTVQISNDGIIGDDILVANKDNLNYNGSTRDAGDVSLAGDALTIDKSAGLITAYSTKMKTGGGIVAPNYASFPSSGELGEIYYDTVKSKLYCYTSSGWIALW